jgi:hypothetical protein
MSDFTPEDKLRAVEREIMMRKRVYTRYVQEGKMKQHQADQGIAVMEAIAEDYAREVAKARLL